MFRFLTVSLALCLILTGAVSAQFRKNQENQEKELLTRLIHELKEIKEVKREECNGNLKDLDKKLWYCYGRICSYEVLDGERILDVEYDERGDTTITINVRDKDYKKLDSKSETDFSLPFSMALSSGGTDYLVTVSAVTAAPDNEGYTMSACVDLSPNETYNTD
ncbi:uncharacterized protein LOC119743598 [Patiria miniata]|uniref:Uncharacterized protein n=1 Tax=Patiria miniata TaxID=46514 RepID=A0A914BJD2_PATMI|nr:uncharacterized protein LOC119743598 [Patiria miniata]